MDKLLLLATAVFAVPAALVGMKRGKKRSLSRLVLIVVAAGLAMEIARPVSNKIVNRLFAGESLSEFVSKLPPAMLEDEGVALVARYIPKMFISIVLFSAVFFVLQLLMYLFQLIVVKRMEKEEKAAGALVGLLCGILVFAIIFAPLLSAIDLAKDIVRVLPDDTFEQMDVPASVKDVMTDFGPVYNTYVKVGNSLNDSLTVISIDRTRISVMSTIREFLQNTDSLF